MRSDNTSAMDNNRSIPEVIAQLSAMRHRYGLKKSGARIQSIEHLPFPLLRIDLSGMVSCAQDLSPGNEERNADPVSFEKSRTLLRCLSGIRTLDVNPAAVAFFGAGSREELISRIKDVFTPASLASLGCLLTEVASGRTSGSMKTILRKVSGEERRVLFQWYTGPDAGTFPSEALAVLADITEMPEPDEALHREQTMRSAIESSVLAGIVMFDMQGRHTYANDAFCRMVGWSREDLFSQKAPYPYWPPEDQDAINRAFALHVSDREQLSELRFMRKNGKRFHSLVLGSPVRNAAGTVTGWLACIYDVTEYKLVEEKLRQSENKYRLLFDSVPVGIGVATPDGTILESNPALSRITGYSEAELKELKVFSAYVREEDWQALLDRIRSNGRVSDFETQLRHKSGLPYHALLNMERVNLLGRDVVLTSVRDIADLKGKEHAVRLYQSGLAALLELSRMNNCSVPDMIRFVLERCVEITESQAGTLTLLGDEERYVANDVSVGPAELTLAVKERAWPPPRSPVCVNAAEGHPRAGGPALLRVLSVPLVQDDRVVCILKVVNKETDYGDADIHRVRLLLDGLWRHIREQNFQEEFLKSQKMESLSLLAGNMGNDFNNLLTGIVGNLDLAKLYTDPNSKLFQLLEEAEAATVRARHLTHQLMTFARTGSPQRRVVSLREILSEAAHFVLRGSAVKPVILLPEHLWPALVDEGQISQVVHNLLLNALQAMTGGGTVWVQGENVTVGPGSIIPVAPGPYVRFSVRDSGPGIREEIRTQIFDPYFTTREKATGLGLTTSFTIIQKHQGHMTCESRPGQGARFMVYLPASVDTVSRDDQAQGEICVGEEKGRILFMDDEETVRKVAGRMLGILGFETEFASDGAEAIEKYWAMREKGRPADAVIMDLTVSGSLGGREAADKLRQIDPEAVIILSTGFTNDPLLSRFRDLGFQGMITKPFKLGMLSEALQNITRQALDPRQARLFDFE